MYVAMQTSLASSFHLFTVWIAASNTLSAVVITSPSTKLSTLLASLHISSLTLAGYLMPEEQQGEEEEDDDEEMDEEYTPEMAQELMRRGLILSKPTLAAPQLAVLGIIASLTQRCVVIQIHGALSFLALLLFHANKPLNVCKVETDSRLPLKSSRNAQI